MNKSIFYSWQSDLPNNTNRGFIRSCIDQAVKNVHSDLGVEEALRVEAGIEGIPGNVDVARTIFERIDACGIFVPDISIVTQTGAKRPMPNPNVLIEYGRATATLGDNRIVPVFNEAFGDWQKDRPFDMRHKNRPLDYHLPEDHDQDQKEAARKKLVKNLERAIHEIFKAGLLEDQPVQTPAFEPVAPYSGPEGNSFPQALLGRIDIHLPLQEGDTKVWLRRGPQVFLRLIPTKLSSDFAPLDLLDSLKSNGIYDLLGSRTTGAFYYDRNPGGASAFTIDLSMTTENKRDAYALGVTQAFSNGELWGIDTWLLDPERTTASGNSDLPLIAPHMLEEGLMSALSQYLRFARDVLSLPMPLRCVAGMREIGNHRFEFPDGEFGRSVGNNCVADTLVDDYQMRIHRILEPFFTKVWMEFGRHRPQEAIDKWDSATGLDLDAKA